jgi:hypothetical protein
MAWKFYLTPGREDDHKKVQFTINFDKTPVIIQHHGYWLRNAPRSTGFALSISQLGSNFAPANWRRIVCLLCMDPSPDNHKILYHQRRPRVAKTCFTPSFSRFSR